MRRWLARLGVVALLGLVPAGPAVPAHASAVPVEFEVRNEPASGNVGDTIGVVHHTFLFGSGDTQPGWVMHEYVAPPGTELVGSSAITDPDLYRVYPFDTPNCTWITPKIHVQCIPWASYFHYQGGEGGTAGDGVRLVFKIVAPVTGPGLTRTDCVSDDLCVDRYPSNNSAPIVINIIAPTPSATAKATRKPAPQPTTPSAPPATEPTPMTAPTDTPGPGPTPGQSPLATDLAARPSGGTSFVPFVGVGLAVLGAAGFLAFRRRRRRLPLP